MRFSEVLAASLVAPLVAAHGDHGAGIPKLFGLNPGQLKSRNIFDGPVRSNVQAGPRLQARQGGVDGQCGSAASGASCAAGYCCSSAGWCGNTAEYCMAPDCQINFGPGCDANKTPKGGNTSTVARPQLGAVAYGGEGIYACKVPGTVAITYDDGPYSYTAGVLDQFKAYGFKATFFITGININKGAIDDTTTPWPAVIKRMIAEGHQVASHTWSHQDLSAITKAQRMDQMVKNEMAFNNIIGKFPTYMRPPYSSCTAASGCQADLKTLGYVVSYFDLDTDDYNNVTPDKIQNAKNNFYNAVNPAATTKDFLAIAHDIHQQTAQNLTGYMLDLLVKKGFKGVTMGECMGEAQANWYRTGAGTPNPSSTVIPASSTSKAATSSAAVPASTKATTDGSCGGTGGMTCKGFVDGQCCSQYGWCGASTDHCGTGCQPGFGLCGSSSASSTSVVKPATSSIKPATSTIKPATSTVKPVSSSVKPSSTSTKAATPTGKVSTDGTCGGTTKAICLGSTFGNCCSQYGWCGSTTAHCGTGCQKTFGSCT
ncbi:hypothetical protein BDV96DRAFT_266726 [Lophiotrema nucula]|uniref:Glycoside hydrolase/deacetylase n=1 Tax=Lophiotrema nucula TaxID=690887 RepID=A0A6A5ZQB4_9PLEO|nr:hypothetical protein BDV96DRAFT_266726 [Lophiotrema nucula]